MRSSSPRKAEFLEKAEKGKELDGHEKALKSYAYGVYGYGFYNTSPLDFRMLTDDAENVAGNVRGYIAAFSPDVRDVMLRFNFDPIIDRLARADLLYQVVGRFADADLYPDTISNTDMGYLYEELVRRFSELSNETAGERCSPSSSPGASTTRSGSGESVTPGSGPCPDRPATDGVYRPSWRRITTYGEDHEDECPRRRNPAGCRRVDRDRLLRRGRDRDPGRTSR